MPTSRLKSLYGFDPLDVIYPLSHPRNVLLFSPLLYTLSHKSSGSLYNAVSSPSCGTQLLCPYQALVETKKELLKAATAAGEAAADAERLRRHVQSVEGEVSAPGRRKFPSCVYVCVCVRVVVRSNTSTGCLCFIPGLSIVP